MKPIKELRESGYNYRVMEVNLLQAKMIKMLEEENAKLKVQIIDRDKIIETISSLNLNKTNLGGDNE